MSAILLRSILALSETSLIELCEVHLATSCSVLRMRFIRFGFWCACVGVVKSIIDESEEEVALSSPMIFSSDFSTFSSVFVGFCALSELVDDEDDDVIDFCHFGSRFRSRPAQIELILASVYSDINMLICLSLSQVLTLNAFGRAH